MKNYEGNKNNRALCKAFVKLFMNQVNAEYYLGSQQRSYA